MKVLIPGSFDPVTQGHASLIRRAAALFDEVVVLVCDNSEKRYLFTSDERLALVRTVCAAAGANVSAARTTGTVAGYARDCGFDGIVKGVRNAIDLDYEQDMATLNRLAGAPETLFLATEPAYAHISSSAVREFLRRDLPATELLPPEIAEDVCRLWREKKGS